MQFVTVKKGRSSRLVFKPQAQLRKAVVRSLKSAVFSRKPTAQGSGADSQVGCVQPQAQCVRHSCGFSKGTLNVAHQYNYYH